MYAPAEARPGHSRVAAKINLFARIGNFFKESSDD